MRLCRQLPSGTRYFEAFPDLHVSLDELIAEGVVALDLLQTRFDLAQLACSLIAQGTQLGNLVIGAGG